MLSLHLRTKRVPRRLAKPDLGGGISHPARFSPRILAAINEELLTVVPTGTRVFDPFWGTGLLADLGDFVAFGTEIEMEWARLRAGGIVADATRLPFRDNSIEAAATSPTYGNRMADAYGASDPESRRSYQFDLGHELHPRNTGAMQWNHYYRRMHLEAWTELARVLKPGAPFVLNCKDHYRNRERQMVTAWHIITLGNLGFTVLRERTIGSRNLAGMANDRARVRGEQVVTFIYTGL